MPWVYRGTLAVVSSPVFRPRLERFASVVAPHIASCCTSDGDAPEGVDIPEEEGFRNLEDDYLVEDNLEVDSSEVEKTLRLFPLIEDETSILRKYESLFHCSSLRNILRKREEGDLNW